MKVMSGKVVLLSTISFIAILFFVFRIPNDQIYISEVAPHATALLRYYDETGNVASKRELVDKGHAKRNDNIEYVILEDNSIKVVLYSRWHRRVLYEKHLFFGNIEKKPKRSPGSEHSTQPEK